MNIEEQNKLFFGKIAGYYDIIFGNWIKKIQIKTIKLAEINNKSRILDAGCGTGNFLSLLENYNIGAYGIDISKEMIKIAKKKLKKPKLKISSAERLNFKSNYFDYIFSIDAFHHFYNKEKAMKSFYRVLKDNGKLIIVDVNFGIFLNKIFKKLEPGNNGIYSKSEMKSIFLRYKLRKIEQRNVGLFTTMTKGVK